MLPGRVAGTRLEVAARAAVPRVPAMVLLAGASLLAGLVATVALLVDRQCRRPKKLQRAIDVLRSWPSRRRFLRSRGLRRRPRSSRWGQIPWTRARARPLSLSRSTAGQGLQVLARAMIQELGRHITEAVVQQQRRPWRHQCRRQYRHKYRRQWHPRRKKVMPSYLHTPLVTTITVLWPCPRLEHLGPCLGRVGRLCPRRRSRRPEFLSCIWGINATV
mmetsp:Transcript_90405/g.193815  ORF Transcript_90405/g.193815 Transcript_90405/m.193815 type:complete len:218 (+) Transcript_90405:638-1291(+)